MGFWGVPGSRTASFLFRQHLHRGDGTVLRIWVPVFHVSGRVCPSVCIERSLLSCKLLCHVVPPCCPRCWAGRAWTKLIFCVCDWLKASCRLCASEIRHNSAWALAGSQDRGLGHAERIHCTILWLRHFRDNLLLGLLASQRQMKHYM